MISLGACVPASFGGTSSAFFDLKFALFYILATASLVFCAPSFFSLSHGYAYIPSHTHTHTHTPTHNTPYQTGARTRQAELATSTGHAEQDWQNRTDRAGQAGKGLPGQVSQDRAVRKNSTRRKDSQERTATQPEQDRREGTGGKGQAGRDRWEGTGGKGQAGSDKQEGIGNGKGRAR